MPRKPAPRFLAPGGGGGTHGYRHTPLRHLDATMEADDADTVARIAAATSMLDEPECVGPAIVDRYGTDAAAMRQLELHRRAARARAWRVTLPPEVRVMDAKARAKRQHVDISRDVFIIEKMLARAAKGGRHVPVKAVERLERVEARLDGVA